EGTISDLVEVLREFKEMFIGAAGESPEALVELLSSILEPMVELQLKVSEKLAKKVLYTEGTF
ncbi:unnamed protein product, partial [marine sediment metagenome]